MSLLIDNQVANSLNGKNIEQLLNQILDLLKLREKGSFGYSCGNLINFFRHLETNLTDYDFSKFIFK